MSDGEPLTASAIREINERCRRAGLDHDISDAIMAPFVECWAAFYYELQMQEIREMGT